MKKTFTPTDHGLIHLPFFQEATPDDIFNLYFHQSDAYEERLKVRNLKKYFNGESGQIIMISGEFFDEDEETEWAAFTAPFSSCVLITYHPPRETKKEDETGWEEVEI